MAYNTIIQSGSFTQAATAKDVKLSIRSDLDFMWVWNYSNAGATDDDSVQFYWQRGMDTGTGLRYFKSGGGNNLNIATLSNPDGFVLLDTSGNPLSASVDTTSITDATEPVISTGDTGGLFAGSIVRLLSNATDKQLNGYDFAVDTISDDTSFKIAAPLANAGGEGGAQAGKYRIVNFDPLYYPRYRLIANITQASQAVVTLTVPSGYKVGQKVRFVVPNDIVSSTSVWGMTEMNDRVGTITAVDDTLGTQTITVDIDSSGFTAFSFPTAAQAASPLNKAMVVPLGEDTSRAISSSTNILSDATDNQGFLGMKLPAGDDKPGGGDSNVLYWVAGKSFSVDSFTVS